MSMSIPGVAITALSSYFTWASLERTRWRWKRREKVGGSFWRLGVGLVRAFDRLLSGVVSSAYCGKYAVKGKSVCSPAWILKGPLCKSWIVLKSVLSCV